MASRTDSLITATLVTCAVLTTALVVRREFLTPKPAAPEQEKPALINDWKTHLSKGVQMGSAAAPVQIIEFADFECPFCSRYHQQLKALRVRYPTQVSLTYVHYPLEMHRFAEPAARVAECARAQGRFEPMYDRLFEGQKEFGLKAWSEFADAAGVPDIAAFEACAQSKEPVPQIEAGKQLARELDVRGTPTVIVNGWKLGRPPDEKELDSMVKAVLAGKRPDSAV